MSEFHYVRTPGSEGGVDAADGPAIGLDLETVLADGLPPWNVALQIVAALCEILDIADEDSEIHGDMHPRFAFIDETGAISVEGFGMGRDETPAPEGKPVGTRTDLYGLGYTAFCIVAQHALPHPIGADGRDAHDDRVIDAALEIDLTEVPDEMQGDIQWFIAKLMSHDPKDRPKAVETWRTFIAFSNALEGPALGDWCAAVLDGGGQRREAAKAEAAPEATGGPTPVEDLGGPVVQKGPLSTTMAFDEGGGNKGNATAFWTRSAMKRALDRVAVEQASEEGPPMGIGGGSATSFWSRDQLDAMARGDNAAPRPRRAAGEGERRKSAAYRVPPAQRDEEATMLKIEPKPVKRRIDPRAPTRRVEPVSKAVASHTTFAPRKPPPDKAPAATPAATPPPKSAGSRAKTKIAGPSVPKAAGSRAKTKIAGPSPSVDPAKGRPSEAPEDGGGRLTYVLFGGGVAAVGATVIGGLLVILILLGAYIYTQGGTGTVPSTTIPVDVPPPVPTIPMPPPPVTPPPVPRPPPPRPTTSNPNPRVSPPPRPPPRPPPTPPPLPAGADARVRITSTGRGNVSRCTPQTIEFDGRRAFIVEGYTLPATCLVTIDGARGVFQVFGEGDISCDRQGPDVICDKNQVP